MELPPPDARRLWSKSLIAVPTGLFVLASLVSIGKDLGPYLIVPGLLAMGVLVCAYTVLAREPSRVSPDRRVPVSNASVRKRALLAGSVFLFLLLAWLVALLNVLDASSMRIAGLEPVDPIAGARLVIFGENFPNRSNLSVSVGGVTVSEYGNVGETVLEVRVPAEAVSGPLRLTRRSAFFPDRHLLHPIVSVQQLGDDVVLFTERLKLGGDHVSLLFSMMNVAVAPYIVVYDIRLEVLAVELLAQSYDVADRIELGVLPVLGDGGLLDAVTADIRQLPTAHLLGENRVVRIDAEGSESFSFAVHRASVEHDARFYFVVAAHYVDGSGNGGQAYSSRIFAIRSSDMLGVREESSLPLSQESIDMLKARYGEGFRDIFEPVP